MSQEFVYVVVQTGVYRHLIAGVYLELDMAVNEAKHCLMSECDRYHTYEVVKIAVDARGPVQEEIVREVAWRDNRSSKPGGPEDIVVRHFRQTSGGHDSFFEKTS